MEESRDLLIRAHSGDPAAFERLVRAETGRLYALARRVTGDRHLAEDVLQELFLGIVERRAPYRGAGSARAWLSRAVVRGAIDSKRLRAAARRRESVHSARREAEAAAPGSGLE